MIEEFTKYYETFAKKDGVVYKYKHSIRVMDLCIELATKLKLNNNDVELASKIGLLHDYARFEQYDKYETFNDLISFDHGDRAVELLFNENHIDNYDVKKDDYQIVKDAIKYHNKYQIPELDERNTMFCNIIRDADKIDILEYAPAKETNGTIRKEIEESFLKHKTIKHTNDLTNTEKCVSHIALIYDIKYKESLEYLKKINIIKIIKEKMNDEIYTKYINEIEKYMEDLC